MIGRHGLGAAVRRALPNVNARFKWIFGSKLRCLWQTCPSVGDWCVGTTASFGNSVLGIGEDAE
eukprot:6230080-Pyramimonas_sp.AAC.1